MMRYINESNDELLIYIKVRRGIRAQNPAKLNIVKKLWGVGRPNLQELWIRVAWCRI